jgi:hypothetical protein
MATNPKSIGVAMSCDSDDDSMTRTLVKDEFDRILGQFEWHQMYYGDSKSKIEACNADMEKVEYPWDIVVLVSDDMIPLVKGYDDVIRSHMMSSFPDTNGILWFNDGTQGKNLNTLSIMGRKMYDSFGYIYHPSYKSLFCDTEFTDLCNGSLASKCLYVDYCIIRHEHPGTGFKEKVDALYASNQKYWNEDMKTYIDRKKYDYDWTILIASIAGREASLKKLLESIHEKRNRLCPALKIQVTVAYDNKEKSIGLKRQSLLESALGKYLSFVDDDDDVTDSYFEDALTTIEGKYDVCRLRGKISQFTFTHSIETTLDSKMSKNGVFTRPPNHLNVMISTAAKFIKFGNAISGEDLDWTIRLAQSGFLTNEYRPDSNRIHYIYNLGDRVITEKVLEGQANITVLQGLTTQWRPAPEPKSVPEKSGGLRLGPKGFVSL